MNDEYSATYWISSKHRMIYTSKCSVLYAKLVNLIFITVGWICSHKCAKMIFG